MDIGAKKMSEIGSTCGGIIGFMFGFYMNMEETDKFKLEEFIKILPFQDQKVFYEGITDGFIENIDYAKKIIEQGQKMKSIENLREHKNSAKDIER